MTPAGHWPDGAFPSGLHSLLLLLSTEEILTVDRHAIELEVPVMETATTREAMGLERAREETQVHALVAEQNKEQLPEPLIHEIHVEKDPTSLLHVGKNNMSSQSPPSIVIEKAYIT